jgi:ferredoxin-like protein FixX
VSSRSAGDEDPPLTVVESVRCLECGAVYAKPRAGGTVRENPGCPDCGYVGWVASPLQAVTQEWQLPRSAAGRQPHRLG